MAGLSSGCDENTPLAYESAPGSQHAMSGLRARLHDAGACHTSRGYRTAVRRKMDAYHRHIQICLVAQGTLQYLATAHPRLVWASFGSWLRTIRPGVPPSEFVVATALAHSLPRFLADTQNPSTFKKFLCENMDNDSYDGFRLTG